MGDVFEFDIPICKCYNYNNDLQNGVVFMIYEGNDNYIFVSYAHRDSGRVLPLIDAMSKSGLRVWYDAGIEAGTEWPAYIEDHLRRASVLLAFMTPNTIASKNCRNEINFALHLEKEILIVYLEDTTLLQGMSLQLNSTQSLLRKSHPSDESFTRELVNARILQHCREDGADPVVPEREFQPHHLSNTRIKNICAIGTDDPNDLWVQGKYSRVINRDKHSVVFFHIFLLNPFGYTGTITNKYRIYNDENVLIFDYEATLEVMPNHDKVSFGWILVGEDGSFVPSGDYRFVCSVNGSPEFSYDFTVCADKDAAPKTSKKSLLEKIKAIFRD